MDLDSEQFREIAIATLAEHEQKVREALTHAQTVVDNSKQQLESIDEFREVLQAGGEIVISNFGFIIPGDANFYGDAVPAVEIYEKSTLTDAMREAILTFRLNASHHRHTTELKNYINQHHTLKAVARVNGNLQVSLSAELWQVEFAELVDTLPR